jgi:hypothetical protein
MAMSVGVYVILLYCFRDGFFETRQLQAAAAARHRTVPLDTIQFRNRHHVLTSVYLHTCITPESTFRPALMHRSSLGQHHGV